MIYFDSGMSKSTNTVVYMYFDWKTIIYIYVCGKCRTQFMLPMEKSVTFTGACANEIIPSINRSFVYKAKEERYVRIINNIMVCRRGLSAWIYISLMSSANGVTEMIVIEKGYPESFAQRLINIDSWKTKYRANKCFGLRLGLWYLAPLSTKFQLHRDGQFNDGRN